jgi:hypothetical protein
MENVTYTSGETEAVRTAPPPPEENPGGGAGIEMTQANQPEIEARTEPENAAAQTQTSRETDASAQGAAREEEVGPSEPGPTDSKHPDGPEKTKRRARDAVMMLQTSPLASGEDFADYRALMDEICNAVDRKDFFDELKVADLGHALWEERRYRQQLVALPKATRFKALVALLLQVSPNFNWKSSDLALDYFGPDAERRDRTKGFLLRYGITDEAITAQAQEMHGQTIGALERMIGARQTLRNRVIKEVQRDKRKAEKKKAKPKPEDGASGTTH